MPHNYVTRERAAVRRRDRAVEDDAWIADLLASAPIAALATAVDGQPFINSNLFAYVPERNVIYVHTARYGRTRANAEGGTPACLSVSEMGRLLPADTALEFSVEYAGVVVFGTLHVVEEPVEAAEGLQYILDKYAPHLRPGTHYRATTPEELARTSVFRIDIEEWSGKRKNAPEDFPGAFSYPFSA
jgi:uncharacterized protein